MIGVITFIETSSVSPESYDIYNKMDKKKLGHCKLIQGHFSVWNNNNDFECLSFYPKTSNNIFINGEREECLNKANSAIRSYYSYPQGGYVVEDNVWL